MQEKARFSMLWLSSARRLAGVGLASSAFWLVGCGSSVKLDEPKPTSAPVTSSSSSSSDNAASAVAPVVASTSSADQASANLARVIYFDYDSFVVKDEFRPTVEGYARVLNAAKGKRMTIEGHTDDRGGREYNLALGQKRAEATVKSLTLLGVSVDQLEGVSFGKERPAVEGSNEQAWAKNRRAEFKNR